MRVQDAPAAAARRRIQRGGRMARGNEQGECQETHGDERALVMSFQYFVNVEDFVENEVGREVQAG